MGLAPASEEADRPRGLLTRLNFDSGEVAACLCAEDIMGDLYQSRRRLASILPSIFGEADAALCERRPSHG